MSDQIQKSVVITLLQERIKDKSLLAVAIKEANNIAKENGVNLYDSGVKNVQEAAQAEAKNVSGLEGKVTE